MVTIEPLIVIGIMAAFLAFREWAAERERRQRSKELNALVQCVLAFKSTDYMRWRMSDTAMEAEAKRPRMPEQPVTEMDHLEGVPMS